MAAALQVAERFLAVSRGLHLVSGPRQQVAVVVPQHAGQADKPQQGLHRSISFLPAILRKFSWKIHPLPEVAGYEYILFDPLKPNEVRMTRITLPPDLERPLVEEARRLGTTPELLALESLRRLFVPQAEPDSSAPGATLFDFLSGHIGQIDGIPEALSENSGRRFADDLVDRHQQGHL